VYHKFVVLLLISLLCSPCFAQIDWSGHANTKTMLTSNGGVAVKLKNRCSGVSVAGKLVEVSTFENNAVQFSQYGDPDIIGVFLESDVPISSEAWIIVDGIADVYFIGSTKRGYLARNQMPNDTGTAEGSAVAEPMPVSPFATDKHFAEIGHVLESRTGAGLAKTLLHFN